MVCFVSGFILFPFVHDTLHLYVRFENDGLKFGFIGVSCDGTFGKVHVHVRPLCKKKFNYLIWGCIFWMLLRSSVGSYVCVVEVRVLWKVLKL